MLAMPKLPIRQSQRNYRITVGPECSPTLFDCRVQEHKVKATLGAFITEQIRRKRFARECPNPLDLGRVIIKHARKRLGRSPGLGQDALEKAGRAVLEHYTDPLYFALVERNFVSTVNHLSQ